MLIMKILHVTPTYVPAYRYGGAVKSVHDLCRALVGKGLEILVITTNIDGDKDLGTPLNKPISVEGVTVIYCSVTRLKSYYYSKDLSEMLKENIPKFDIVHTHSVYLYPTFIAARLSRLYKKPYIIHPFGALDPSMLKLKGYLKKTLYIKLIEQRNIHKAEAVQVDSVYERERFLALGFNRPAAIIPPGLNLSEYTEDVPSKGLRERYPQLKNMKVILFLGRIHFKKGLNLLAYAFKKIVENRKDVYLVIAGPGEGSYPEEIKKLFGKLGLIKQVIFTGMLLGTDKLSAFHNSDIFVLPSYGENFGIAVLEAMACKLPVIITDQVGLYPDVEEYKAGIITDCNSDQIAKAILNLLEDGELRKRMGENGRRLVEDRFTLEKTADKMTETYKKIMSEGSKAFMTGKMRCLF